MTNITSGSTDLIGTSRESSLSSVTWSAVFAGGLVANALGLILLMLGTGLGLASVSPYAVSATTVTKFSIYAAVWLIIVQWLASALGGYVTGRLRTKWVDLHDEEVSFRDTAHGLLAWAFAVALGVALTGIGAAASGKTTSPNRTGYYVDELFRADKSGDPAALADSKQQAREILSVSAASGDVKENDRMQLAQLVMAQAGLPTGEASKRVDDVVQQASNDAEEARTLASRISIYGFFSLLIGAFIASVAGAIGGRKRDAV